MELQASAALQTLASVKSKKQGKTAKPAAMEEEAGQEEEQEAEDEEASAASVGTPADTSADTAETATVVIIGETADVEQLQLNRFQSYKLPYTSHVTCISCLYQACIMCLNSNTWPTLISTCLVADMCISVLLLNIFGL